MNEKIFAKEEFIGLPINVNQCNDPSWIGKSGIIIDETKNMFIIKVNKKKNKSIEKRISKFEFEYNGNKIILNGSKLAYRPEDRIKKTR
ncbi:MAG: ribonuclease P protein subunit [Candidatus Thermoplasmatota archaeon]|nr:ribonuclease P protein subunit [Candidatus Thermoplasmatota archaeon]